MEHLHFPPNFNPLAPPGVFVSDRGCSLSSFPVSSSLGECSPVPPSVPAPLLCVLGVCVWALCARGEGRGPAGLSRESLGQRLVPARLASLAGCGRALAAPQGLPQRAAWPSCPPRAQAPAPPPAPLAPNAPPTGGSSSPPPWPASPAPPLPHPSLPPPPPALPHRMREIVHLQAGQCGNQIGSKFCEWAAARTHARGGRGQGQQGARARRGSAPCLPAPGPCTPLPCSLPSPPPGLPLSPPPPSRLPRPSHSVPCRGGHL